jgi:N6-adenosine-specific RNA methylase IME4
MELITKSFAEQCIAFPSKVDRALATVATVQDAKSLLDKATVMCQYAEKLKAGVEVSRPIAFGVLKIKAKLGELLAAKTRSESGALKGKKGGTADSLPFAKSTVIDYRKIAAHKDKLDSYYQSIDDVPTQSDFLRSIKEPKHKKPAPENTACESEGITSDLTTLTGTKYGTIYADPPWKYGNQGTRAATDNHYGTMTVNDICELPVRELAADDAHLHLWTTNAFLFDAKKLMDAWGFEYRSVFVWVKPQMGIGNYWRVSHEFMLLGIKGDAKRFNERNHMSWKSFDRTKHSAKPDEIRGIIEKVSPGPFLELFGRKPISGWTVFGNQIQEVV